MKILQLFLVRCIVVKIVALFFRNGKIDHMSQLCQMSSQLLRYMNIFYINGRLLSHGCNIFCVL